MTKNSMAGLSEKLQQQLKDDQLAVSAQTELLLKQHALSLQRLSSVSLSTTRSAIQQQHQSLQGLHEETFKRLKWMMLWPALTIIFLGLLIVSATGLWSWWKLSQVDDQVRQKVNQIQKLEAEFCRSPAGQQVCKKGG